MTPLDKPDRVTVTLTTADGTVREFTAPADASFRGGFRQSVLDAAGSLERVVYGPKHGQR